MSLEVDFILISSLLIAQCPTMNESRHNHFEKNMSIIYGFMMDFAHGFNSRGIRKLNLSTVFLTRRTIFTKECQSSLFLRAIKSNFVSKTTKLADLNIM